MAFPGTKESEIEIKAMLLIVFFGFSLLFWSCESRFYIANTGRTVILGNCGWDIDSNKVVESSKIDSHENIDLWWQVTDKERSLVPKNGASIVILPVKRYEDLSLEDLLGFTLSKDEISGLEESNPLKPGTVIALRTGEGKMAKLRVIQYHRLHCLGFDGAEALTSAWRDSVLAMPNRDNCHIELGWKLYSYSEGYSEVSD